MLTTSMVAQILLGTSIASAVVTPSQLYEVINRVVDFYINDSCLVVISSCGYTTGSYVPAVYMHPYNHEAQDSSEENYKMVTIAPILEIGCTGFLVQVENPGRQLRLIETTFAHVIQRTERRFIFLPTVIRGTKTSIVPQEEVLDAENFDFQSVLREKSIQYIPDMVFAVPNNKYDEVTLITHRFTGPDDVANQERLLDTYDVAKRRFNLSANLFPDKIKNLEGKILKVAAFHYPPAIIIINDTGNVQIDGVEWRFVQKFAEHHNCSLKELVNEERAWGEIYSNMTGTGISGNVLEDNADLAITDLFYGHYRYGFFDLSNPLYRAGVTCLVPGPRQLPLWMSPILPFSSPVWATFIGSTIVATVFTGLVNRAESILSCKDSVRMTLSEVMLTVAGITLLQGLRKEPKGPSWAVLSITLLIVSLLIVTAYGSSLASATTLPRYEAPIDTASELAVSGIPWSSTSRTWLLLIVDNEEPEMKLLVKNFQVQSEAEIFRHSADGESWAFAIERLQGGHYSIQEYVSRKSVDNMHLMKADIYWAYVVGMLRKSSPFTRWYNQRILEIQASGISAYWETDTALRYLDARTQLTVSKNLIDHRPMSITVSQVQGTFFVLIIGLVLSGLVFLGELSIRQKVSSGTENNSLI